VKVVNDASLQAMGSYQGGKMLLSWAVFTSLSQNPAEPARQLCHATKR
jgi:hypothetical protein